MVTRVRVASWLRPSETIHRDQTHRDVCSAAPQRHLWVSGRPTIFRVPHYGETGGALHVCNVYEWGWGCKRVEFKDVFALKSNEEDEPNQTSCETFDDSALYTTKHTTDVRNQR